LKFATNTVEHQHKAINDNGSSKNKYIHDKVSTFPVKHRLVAWQSLFLRFWHYTRIQIYHRVCNEEPDQHQTYGNQAQSS